MKNSKLVAKLHSKYKAIHTWMLLKVFVILKGKYVTKNYFYIGNNKLCSINLQLIILF